MCTDTFPKYKDIISMHHYIKLTVYIDKITYLYVCVYIFIYS